MNPLVALALSTPIWGFALQPPTLASVTTGRVAPIHYVAVEPYIEPPTPTSGGAEARNRTTMDSTAAFQLASAVGMAVTNVLGAIQFADEYGLHSEHARTACATGDAVLDYCERATPVAHVVAAGATAGLGLTAFALSTQIDYDMNVEIDDDWRAYEVTRWLGLGMNAAQALFGFLLANAIRFGWANEQRDFDTLQGFAIAHTALGMATLGVEAYNAILLF